MRKHIHRRRRLPEICIVDDRREWQPTGGLDFPQHKDRILYRPGQRPGPVDDEQHLIIVLGQNFRHIAPQCQRSAVVSADVQHAAYIPFRNQRVGLLRHGRNIEIRICKR